MSILWNIKSTSQLKLYLLRHLLYPRQLIWLFRVSKTIPGSCSYKVAKEKTHIGAERVRRDDDISPTTTTQYRHTHTAGRAERQNKSCLKKWRNYSKAKKIKFIVSWMLAEQRTANIMSSWHLKCDIFGSWYSVDVAFVDVAATATDAAAALAVSCTFFIIDPLAGLFVQRMTRELRI